MISKISSFVQGSKSASLLHVLGGTVSSVILGLLIGIFASITQLLSDTQSLFLLLALAAMLLVAGLADLGFINIPLLNVERQTPGSWPCSLGQRPAAFAWGLDLGLGVSTRVAYVSIYAIPVAAALSGGVLAAMAVMGAFGLGRTVAVAVPSLALGASSGDFCTRISHHQGNLNLLAGGMTMAVGCFVLTITLGVI